MPSHAYVRYRDSHIWLSARSEPKEGRKLTNLVAGSLRTTYFHLATVSWSGSGNCQMEWFSALN